MKNESCIGKDFTYKNFKVGYCYSSAEDKDRYEGYIYLDNNLKYMFKRKGNKLKLFNMLGHEKSVAKKLPKELIGLIYSNFSE